MASVWRGQDAIVGFATDLEPESPRGKPANGPGSYAERRDVACPQE